MVMLHCSEKIDRAGVIECHVKNLYSRILEGSKIIYVFVYCITNCTCRETVHKVSDTFSSSLKTCK